MALLRRVWACLSAAAAVVGAAAFIILSLFYRRTAQCVTEAARCQPALQVLVLGLDGSGKSSVLRALSSEPITRSRSTRGFNFLSVRGAACRLDFLEIGGAEDLRRHWLDHLRRTHLLLFVVDSSDSRRLPLAKVELHRLLRAEPQLPVVVLGNKQDKRGRVSGSALLQSLSLSSDSDHRTLLLSQLDAHGALTTSPPQPDRHGHPQRLQELLRVLCRRP